MIGRNSTTRRPVLPHLAELIGGTVIGESIAVDGTLIGCTLLGVVKVNNGPTLGQMSDGAERLAAAFRAWRAGVAS